MTCRNSWEILQYIPSLSVQQCKVQYQPCQELLITYVRKRTRYWTDCYQKAKNSSRSNLVMFNFLTFSTFPEVLPILIHSWKLERHQRQKDSFHSNCLTTKVNWKTKNFRLTKLFETIFENVCLLKTGIVTTRSWSVLVWRQSLRLSKRGFLKHRLLEKRTIATRRNCGSRKKCNHSKTFWAGTITKTLSQLWNRCIKWSSFITTKALICSSLDVLTLTIVCTVLAMQIFIHSQKAIKISFQKFGKICLEDRQ